MLVSTSHDALQFCGSHQHCLRPNVFVAG
uniref:Uncharacterized protein n=1 Tax=Arundo donax TaxID=35708 RepID=A0A0A9AYI0_ARUDO